MQAPFQNNANQVLGHMERADGTQTPIRAWRSGAISGERKRTGSQKGGRALASHSVRPSGPDAMCPGKRPRQFVVTRIACVCAPGNYMLTAMTALPSGPPDENGARRWRSVGVD
jgi:hypothetical protein